MRDKVNYSIDNKTAYYPFIVSERDREGKVQFSQLKTRMHGVGIYTDGPMVSKLFNSEDEGGVKQGTTVYEIRVKSNSGDWQDWQAIVGDIKIVPFLEWQLENHVDDLFEEGKKKFQNHFEMRVSGLLWRSLFGEVTIIDEELELVKRVNPFTLEIEYRSDLDNNCNPFEEQIAEQMRFRKKYFAYGNRL
ncbi:hypothetical protein BTS2_2969 [Bacillus sp. TS-2]|nr:hypothetical protein BTS2_2969 [Bacillus sp. TS-2]